MFFYFVHFMIRSMNQQPITWLKLIKVTHLMIRWMAVFLIGFFCEIFCSVNLNVLWKFSDDLCWLHKVEPVSMMYTCIHHTTSHFKESSQLSLEISTKKMKTRFHVNSVIRNFLFFIYEFYDLKPITTVKALKFCSNAPKRKILARLCDSC